MRLVQLSVPTGKRESIRSVLDAEGIDYVMIDEHSDKRYAAVVFFPLPTEAVEPVLEDLREAGLDEDAFTVIVDAKSVVSRRFEALEEKYAEAEESEERIARQEIHAAASDLMPSTRYYIALTIVSAVVATAGVLLNSAAVVVGSMVIAPLVGPALSASTGTVLDDPEMQQRGVILQVIGVVGAIVAATIFAFFVQLVNVVPPGLDVLSIDQVRERIAPDFLALAIALGAGIAGALSLSTGVSTALVGVMIAAALIPPAAVVGIGVAWNIPELAIGSFVLVVVNVLSINLAALLVLWYQGYRPESWFRQPEVRVATIKRAGVLAVTIAVLSLFLGGVTVASYQGAVAEEEIRTEIEGIVADHEELVLLDLAVETDDHPLRSDVTGVEVTIGKPAAEPIPELAEMIADRIAAIDKGPVDVEVRYVELQRN